MTGMGGDLGNFSMVDLFRTELEQQSAVMTEGMLALENGSSDPAVIERLMRAAHSIKGAGRLVDITSVVRIAHVIEDVFVAAKTAPELITPDRIDVLLRSVDTLVEISKLPEAEMRAWADTHRDEMESLVSEIGAGPAPKHIGSARNASAPARSPTAIEEETPASAPGTPTTPGGEADNDSLLPLFRVETEQHGKALVEGLLALEKDIASHSAIEAVMRAAHSIKGAARLVGIDLVEQLAHIMEDLFVAAQHGQIALSAGNIDVLLKAVDVISIVSQLPPSDIGEWQAGHELMLNDILDALSKARGKADAAAGQPQDSAQAATKGVPGSSTPQSAKPAAQTLGNEDRVLRVSAERWDRLIGLTGEVKVNAGWLHPYLAYFDQLKKRQVDLAVQLDALRDSLHDIHAPNRVKGLMADALRRAGVCRQLLMDQVSELDDYDRRLGNLSSRLHRETIATRMRPFSDGVQGFQRMVRDIARSLGKKVRLEINGLNTQVDRDVLEKMEAPLNHILRNAMDHGVEEPEERVRGGKPEQAVISLSAYHAGGLLTIVVEDDGRGVDTNRLRQRVVEKGMVAREMASNLSEEELLEFLFLPGFSTREQVTDLSGRGVGLDVVMDTVKKLRGQVHITTNLGQGTRFYMQLPLTLSVISALLVEIAGDSYAFPLARIVRAIRVAADDIKVIEDHQYVTVDGQHVGLVAARQALELDDAPIDSEELSVIVVSDRYTTYGVAVDKLIGQRELAVQAIDSRLGKLQDISAAAVLENGSPVLIIDVDDMVRTLDGLSKKGRLFKVSRDHEAVAVRVQKQILVIDDSLTVREVERQLLEGAGYRVDVAVDGMDGWNALRSRNYNLVISDIDMPRMDGIELVRTIRADRRLNSLPIMIVSYKERAEDRRRGMEAGADYYLTKGSFHDDTLLKAVVDLIGEARE